MRAKDHSLKAQNALRGKIANFAVCALIVSAGLALSAVPYIGFAAILLEGPLLIGFFFLMPYVATASANFYLHLKGEDNIIEATYTENN